MIVGLGKTGLSCARYFTRAGVPFSVMDANPVPAGLPDLRQLDPDTEVLPFSVDALLEADEIVLSPGVPLSTPEIQAARSAGVPVTGDIDMFGRLATAPLIAITGSNGKSTVTALVGEMARTQGEAVGVGGNIGTPCLDLLEQDCELYVLEVSSYQLEVAWQLESEAAVVLNLSPDHLDRYPDAATYFRTKTRIYQRTRHAIVNRDIDFDLKVPTGIPVITFGVRDPGTGEFGLRKSGGTEWLAFGPDNLIATSELPIRGRHNHVNALAALAVGSALDWDFESMIDTLRRFEGLRHRSEKVACVGGADYINDSKSTNVGSTLAAVEGMAADARALTLILGGIGKGADFSVLVPVLERSVDRVFVYGRDRDVIASQLGSSTPIHCLETLEAVMAAIFESAGPDETVLFSPGCASFDQFENFEARGDRFRALVTAAEDRP